jgi:hypothetical protein
VRSESDTALFGANSDVILGMMVPREAKLPGIIGNAVRLTKSRDQLRGVGFGLILVACLALYGRPIDRSQGVCWGLAGFAVFTLAPALGLPPEAPGGMTADLADRQAWWIFAGAAAACGLGLLRFGKAWPWRLVGIGALILPHLVGAPTPERFGGGAPPELTARFAATSIAVSAIFWALLGWLTAVFYERSQNARHPDQPGWREDPSRPSRFRREWPVGGDPVRREFSGLIDRCGCGVSSLSAHHQCARATPPQRKCRSVQCPSKRLFSPSKPRHAWLKPLVACAERLDGQAAR